MTTDTDHDAGPPPLPLDGEGFEPLPAQARWLFRLRPLIPLMLFALPALIVGVPLLGRVAGLPAAFAAWAAIVGLLAWLAWQHAGRAHAATALRLDADGFTLRSGVWWRSERYVARSRVQHTDLQRGPLARRLGLAELVIHTAGTELASIRVPGLDADRAHALRDALLEGHDQQL